MRGGGSYYLAVCLVCVCSTEVYCPYVTISDEFYQSSACCRKLHVVAQTASVGGGGRSCWDVDVGGRERQLGPLMRVSPVLPVDGRCPTGVGLLHAYIA